MKSKSIFIKISIFLVGLIISAAGIGLSAPPGPTIVDVAIAINSQGDFAGQFDTLIAAVLAADPVVLDTLNGNGQFTVFAPNDVAFQMPDINSVNVGQVNQAFLTDVLLYHVARGRRYSEKVLASKKIRMLKGGFLLQNGGVLTDNLGREADIVVTDVEAANGIIHAINRVVLPYAP
ncbi:MAG: fasciclin domain-containing protein [Planctomycetota bacterium]|jgi:uncharacterized surface protein with fasciclin (FAS1) repeats